MVGDAPVIVLSYGNAGAIQLQQLLRQSAPELTCTTGTGVLAACEQAAATWRQIERRPDGALPALAAKSIRAMATQMIMMLVVRSGGRRWCETAAADPSAVETFLQVFPATQVVCLHRCCPGVIAATLQSSPWGISGPGFAPYLAAYPASTLNALTAWWIARVTPLVTFERDHPANCLRLRYEDLTDAPAKTESALRAFLGLTGAAPSLPAEPGVASEPDGLGTTGPERAPFPAAQLPPVLLAQVNELHAALGYPALQP